MPNYDPVFLTFNDKPPSVVRGMDELTTRRRQVESSYQKRKRIPLFIFLAGLPFLCLDLILWLVGYPTCLFSFVTLAFGIGALVVFLSLRSSRIMELPPLFYTSRDIIYTLRDDANPKRVFFGQLDLTGTEQKTKVAREGKNALGMGVTLYRDTWLTLKTKLYDGNMLRLSASRRLKVRNGYWGRGRVSGKSKWKAAKTKADLQELKVMISVNPEYYEIVPKPALRQKSQIGSYVIERLDTTNGIIQLLASSGNQAISSGDVLGVLRAAYDLLQRKETA